MESPIWLTLRQEKQETGKVRIVFQMQFAVISLFWRHLIPTATSGYSGFVCYLEISWINLCKFEHNEKFVGFRDRQFSQPTIVVRTTRILILPVSFRG